MATDEFSHLPDPMVLYQAHLDALSAALMNRNFSAFASRMHIPHLVITETNQQTITTKDEMAEIFYALHESLKSEKVTEFLRFAIRAEYKAEDFICGEHETQIISGGRRVVRPYPNRVRLERIGTNWLETASSNAVTNYHVARGMPRVADDPTLAPMPTRDTPSL